jgi:hypothetical protein
MFGSYVVLDAPLEILQTARLREPLGEEGLADIGKAVLANPPHDNGVPLGLPLDRRLLRLREPVSRLRALLHGQRALVPC